MITLWASMDTYSVATMTLLLRPLPSMDPSLQPCQPVSFFWHIILFLDPLPEHMQFPLLGMPFPQLRLITCTYPSKLNSRTPSSKKSSPTPTLGWFGWPVLHSLASYAHPYYRKLLCYCGFSFTCLSFLYLTTTSLKEDTKYCSGFIFLAPSMVWVIY